jgi:hypothetical protein
VLTICQAKAARSGHPACVADLGELLAEHLAASFPISVVKGFDYGEVDPVMIGADIYGWASRVHRGEVLADLDRSRLEQARDELQRSIGFLPQSARPYYEQLVGLASATLTSA